MDGVVVGLAVGVVVGVDEGEAVGDSVVGLDVGLEPCSAQVMIIASAITLLPLLVPPVPITTLSTPGPIMKLPR
jgi:hypothetical protein